MLVQEEAEEADTADEEYVSAVEGPLPPAAAAGAWLSGRTEKCDQFVNQAMQEMGNINICERAALRVVCAVQVLCGCAAECCWQVVRSGARAGCVLLSKDGLWAALIQHLVN